MQFVVFKLCVCLFGFYLCFLADEIKCNRVYFSLCLSQLPFAELLEFAKFSINLRSFQPFFFHFKLSSCLLYPFQDSVPHMLALFHFVLQAYEMLLIFFKVFQFSLSLFKFSDLPIISILLLSQFSKFHFYFKYFISSNKSFFKFSVSHISHVGAESPHISQMLVHFLALPRTAIMASLKSLSNNQSQHLCHLKLSLHQLHFPKRI